MSLHWPATMLSWGEEGHQTECLGQGVGPGGGNRPKTSEMPKKLPGSGAVASLAVG